MRKVGRFRSTIAVVVWLAAVAARAEEPSGGENHGPSATIDAEKMDFDQVSKIYTAVGNVVIHYREDTLRADRVKFNTETKDA